MPSKLLTVAEVRDLLRAETDEFVMELARHKQLTGVKVGRYWRFTQAAVDDYIRRNESPAVDSLVQSTASRSRKRRPT